MSFRYRALLLATTALIPLGIGSARANPMGGQVVGGSATVSGEGTNSVIVTQQSNSAIINWKNFNIGAGQSTNFVQPNASSVVLNRVIGGGGSSQIYGTLTANGRVFLVNPDGILFGAGAVVKTGGFLATTNDIANSDFMSGNYNFSIPGQPDASIVNLGRITSGTPTTSGFAALVAPGVRNDGIITANLGTVALASGNMFTLDMYGDKLITLALNDQIAGTVNDVATGKPLDALVKNTGVIRANGGRVELTAAAAREVVDSVINNTGVIEANTIGTHNGMIVLSAATGASKPAGAPTQTVKVSGRLSAAGKAPGTTGGKIIVTGESIQVANAQLDASGQAGGGTVLVGGDTGGGNPSPAAAGISEAALEAFAVPTASNVSVDAGTTIDVSAKQSGNGGKAVVWSDGTTSVAGTILATGGTTFGNGGFVETSGHGNLAFTGSVDVGAPNGLAGTWLLDPTNVTIGTTGPWIVTPTAIESALATGNVVVNTSATGTDAGDITVAQNVTWANGNALTLSADRNIIVNDGVTISNTGSGNLNLRADAGGIGTGTVTFNGSGKVDYSQSTGLVSIYYNPADNPAGSGINATSYTSATDYSSYVLTNGAVPNQLTAYMLVNNVYDLQNMENNLAGDYALGTNIDASATASWNGGAGFGPIGGTLSTPFTGTLIGSGTASSAVALGATIDGLTTDVTGAAGLFGYIGSSGSVSGIGLTNVSISSSSFAGAIAGWNDGTIFRSYSTGRVSGGALAGGLVGANGSAGSGTSPVILQSYSTSVVTNASGGYTAVGGVAGQNAGLIDQSYATGAVTNSASGFAYAGGLVGLDLGVIVQSYADGKVIGQPTAHTGGLSGLYTSVVGTSATNSYWDSVTTGQTSDGVVEIFPASVVSTQPLTTAQLKSGLPTGFDPAVWGISPSINNGYPYLLWQAGSTPAPSSTTLTGGAPSPSGGDPFATGAIKNLTQGLNNQGTISPPVLSLLTGTPNQSGGTPDFVLGNTPSPAQSATWGWTGSVTRPFSGTYKPNFLPIDTMTVVVNGETKYLYAYANIDPTGAKYVNGKSFALNGPFQCTALVVQYLSLLGDGNAIKYVTNGGDVANSLSTKDPSQFSSSNGGTIPPQIGSIVSFADVAGGVQQPVSKTYPGHVAIVKGITYVNATTISVTLIEDNLTLKTTDTFAVNQTITFVNINGVWTPSPQFRMVSNGQATQNFIVTGWATPI